MQTWPAWRTLDRHIDRARTHSMSCARHPRTECKGDVDVFALRPVDMVAMDELGAKRAKLGAPGGIVLPASADPDLIAQFDARVERTFALLDQAIARDCAIADVREALHKLAGTAAFFGMAELGTIAGDLDRQLGDPACATPVFLADARAALRYAAAGAH